MEGQQVPLGGETQRGFPGGVYGGMRAFHQPWVLAQWPDSHLLPHGPCPASPGERSPLHWHRLHTPGHFSVPARVWRSPPHLEGSRPQAQVAPAVTQG